MLAVPDDVDHHVEPVAIDHGERDRWGARLIAAAAGQREDEEQRDELHALASQWANLRKYITMTTHGVPPPSNWSIRPM
jgi:truncated hemoglobin YjbI